MEATFSYREGSTTFTKVLELNILKGMDDPDRLLRKGNTNPGLDGSIQQQTLGFHKLIEAEIRATTNRVDRNFLAQWLVHEGNRKIIYGLYDEKVAFEQNDPELLADWLYDCEHNRQFTISLISTKLYRVWTDPSPAGDDELDFKNNVVIDDTKTIDDPLVLTTNGNLPTREDGSAWPDYDDTTYDFLVLVQCSNGAVAVYPEKHQVVANNMQITLFPGSGFIFAADGKLYANIAIYKKLKT